MEVSDNAVVVFTATCELGQALWKEVDVYLPNIYKRKRGVFYIME